MRTPAMTLAATLLLLPLACGDGANPAASVEVLTEVRTFVDRTRATPSKIGFEGSPERTLETRIWVTDGAVRDSPACDGDRCALVLLAHGYGGNTARFDAIGRGLAEAGYVVASPKFPLTNDAAPGGHASGLGDTPQQPADLSFVMDAMIDAGGDGADVLLGGRVDPERVAVLGHSLGGVTAIAHSRVECCEDPRVDAVVLVAPVTVLIDALFHEPFAAQGPPTLAMSGSMDPTVLPEVPAAFYDDVEAPKAHLLLTGADHVDLIENTGPAAPALGLTRQVVVAFFDQYLGGAKDLKRVLGDLRGQGHLVRYDLD